MHHFFSHSNQPCKVVLEMHHFFSHSNRPSPSSEVIQMPGLHYPFTTLSITHLKHVDLEAQEIAQLAESF